ncbi:MAG TPA: alpha/beta hydrolase [Rhizomicrobium sp.]|jgi:acetyl esterase/lipase
MPLDRHARRFLEMLAAAGQTRGRYGDVIERRRALADLVDLVDPPGMETIGGVRDQPLDVNDGIITLRTYSPLGKPERLLPGLLFFHGGGWVAGNLETHDGLCRRLCNESGCRIIAVNYRLAPEHAFPAALDDAFAALSHVAANPREFGIDPDCLGVAGDSAGGGLAAALCREARDRNGPKIAFQFLICPILDVARESAARTELRDGYFLDAETLARDLELYCSGADLSDSRLSPLLASDCTGLPPAYIHTAQFDPFGDEGEAYAAKLSDVGIAVHGRNHPGMIHFFYCMQRMIPYARQAAQIMGAEIRYAAQLPPPVERRRQKRTRPDLIRS